MRPYSEIILNITNNNEHMHKADHSVSDLYFTQTQNEPAKTCKEWHERTTN